MLPLDSPAVTAEATKHHGKLAQIDLILRPPEHGSFGAACLSYASSRHTGDAGGNVAEIRQPMLIRYSRLCFSKLDNAVHGPRYASFTSEYPRRNLAPPNATSLTPAIRSQQAAGRASRGARSLLAQRSRPFHRLLIAREVRREVAFRGREHSIPHIIEAIGQIAHRSRQPA